VNQLILEFDPDQNRYPDRVIRKIVDAVWSEYQIDDAHITLIFGDDELLNKLKKEFFKVDQLTDVIAFRLNDYEEPSPEGEVYISLPRARENAKHFEEPEPREIARLIIHGCLHLLGFDDKTDNDIRAMRTREDDILAHVPWDSLIPTEQD